MAIKKKNIMKFVISFSITSLLLVTIFSVTVIQFSSGINSIFSETVSSFSYQKNLSIAKKFRSVLESKPLSRKEILSKMKNISDDDIIACVLYKPTEDENFFRVYSIIYYDREFAFPFKKNEKIAGDLKNNHINSAVNMESIDRKIYNEGNMFFQHIYFPVKNGSKFTIIQLTVNASSAAHFLKLFSQKETALRIKIFSSAVIFSVIIFIITILYMHNLSLFINSLTSVITRAADGKTNIKLNKDADSDFEELAVSLNSLIGGIEEKEKLISEMSDKIDTAELFKDGVQLLKEKDLKHAEAVFLTLIRLRPESFGSYFNLGVIYAKQKYYDSALKMFQKANEINPEYEMTSSYISKVRKHLNGKR